MGSSGISAKREKWIIGRVEVMGIRSTRIVEYCRTELLEIEMTSLRITQFSSTPILQDCNTSALHNFRRNDEQKRGVTPTRV